MSSRDLLDVFTANCYFPINAPEGAQAAIANRGEKNGLWHVAAKAVLGTEDISSTHTFVAEAAKLIKRPLACLDACHDGCTGLTFLIF